MVLLETCFRFPFAVSLRLTLGSYRGVRLGGRRGLPAGAWWATRTPHGPATLHLEDESNGAITARAWGPGAGWALDRLPRLVGVDDDPQALKPHHPLVGELSRRLVGLRLGRTDRVFEALLPTILEQKVTGKEARRSYRRLAQTFGEPAPGPAPLRLAPAPERLAVLAYYDLHPLGVERRRATTIIGAAARAARIEEVASMTKADAYRRLRALGGIGAWTAAKVMGSACGDPDAVPIGDFHLPNIVAWALAGQPRGDDDLMLELLEPYRGQRGRVIRMLKAAGVSAPAYGPRTPIRSFERS